MPLKRGQAPEINPGVRAKKDAHIIVNGGLGNVWEFHTANLHLSSSPILSPSRVASIAQLRLHERTGAWEETEGRGIRKSCILNGT